MIGISSIKQLFIIKSRNYADLDTNWKFILIKFLLIRDRVECIRPNKSKGDPTDLDKENEETEDVDKVCKVPLNKSYDKHLKNKQN